MKIYSKRLLFNPMRSTPIIFLLIIQMAGFSEGMDRQAPLPISEAELLAAQKTWGEAIVSIGKAYTQRQDYKAEAIKTVDELYDYAAGPVLFKPTKAAKNQFRSSRESAISYFVGGEIAEDHGFALQPWSAVRFENSAIILEESFAAAMGNYFFTNAKSGVEAKVEYSFIYRRDSQGALRIQLHHSSLPYQPEH
ncbi:MAG TPA: hypothetical protein ENN84_08265 [Candidatus Marinimicrobia bacterium]|nr:hypothetical protein [Candidatus Neomarinimicrobiota bacterium]